VLRRPILVCVLAASLGALPAALAAQEGAGQGATAQDSAEFLVAGRTPVVCTLTSGPGSGDGFNNFSSADRNVYRVDQMIDAATLSTRAASFELTLNGVCNTAHRIRMESLNNGLWQLSETPPTRPAGFGTAVPYDLTARWTDQVVQISADAAIRQPRERSVPIARPASGDLRLRFEILAGATNLSANAPMVSGAYSDTLTIILEPQQ
jgi:hypothetical protein